MDARRQRFLSLISTQAAAQARKPQPIGFKPQVIDRRKGMDRRPSWAA